MKFLYFFFFILIFSCNKEEEKRPFIVSEFNRNIEKHFEDAKKKNPELREIFDIKLYDYPKGKLNFIFTKDKKIYYYEEEIWDILCSFGLDKLPIRKRKLSKDSLHLIKYQEIKNILKSSINKEGFKNSRKELYPILFIFEKDTIPEYDIQKLLDDVDSLGYHRYNVRRIAPFEEKIL